MKLFQRVAILAMTAALLAPAGRMCAATTENWDVPSGFFSAAENWDTESVPQTGDTAIIANSGASTLSSVYPATPAAVWLGNGAATAGTLTIASGGSLNTGSMVLGQSGGRGVLVLGGGTLAAPSIVNDTGVGILYFDAGTLVATASSSAFLSGLSAAYLRAGGATIDTDGYNVSMNQGLGHDPALGKVLDGGLTKTGAGTLTLTGQDTYTGTTTVDQGTLIVTQASGLLTPSNLTVGNSLAFDPLSPAAAEDSPAIDSASDGAVAPAVAAVPEPGTMLLLAAIFIVAAAKLPIARLLRPWRAAR